MAGPEGARLRARLRIADRILQLDRAHVDAR